MSEKPGQVDSDLRQWAKDLQKKIKQMKEAAIAIEQSVQQLEEETQLCVDLLS